MTVCESLLRDFKFELPGTAVSEINIDAELINDPEKVLAKYRELGLRVDVAKAREEADLYSREFYEKYALRIELTDDAVALLGEEAAKQGRSVLQLCQQRFKDYQFGLKLVQRNIGKDHFELGADAVKDADQFLSDQVVKSYAEAEASKKIQSDDTSLDDDEKTS